jgi:hypothetical protein
MSGFKPQNHPPTPSTQAKIRPIPFGLKRFQQAEALHFITFSCFHRLPYLEQPEPKSTLEAILDRPVPVIRPASMRTSSCPNTSISS